MINKFLTKHNITLYWLANAMDIPYTTMVRWAKTGPQHRVYMSMALRDLARQLRKEQ